MMLDAGASAIVAVATFGGTVRSSPSRWFVGPFGWLLADVRALAAPVPCRGAQGLWAIPPDVETEVLRQLAKAEENEWCHTDA